MPNSGMTIPILGSRPVSHRRARKSLADALFTRTQQRVLRVLFGQPDRSFYASELIRDAATASGAAQRELARLEDSGLIAARRIGNSDIDLMVVSDNLSYGDVFSAVDKLSRTLGRNVNPTVYSAAEFLKRAKNENAFITRVIEAPKLRAIGTENDLPVASCAAGVTICEPDPQHPARR
jgi:hypothetical protein